MQKTVMVVEPDVLIRMAVAAYLRECGYLVIEGVAAADVWAVLEAGRRLDIVMADVSLAGETDGFALASRIRQTRRDVDVILTSSIAGAAHESHALCEDGPIKKPYRPQDIEARIKLLLERRKSNKP